MTVTIALIGHPVAHSFSPAMQQAALDEIAFDARYEAWDVLPEELPQAVEQLRSSTVLGANVTVPHKVGLVGHVDRVDSIAERVGAVNTIVCREGQLHATNTDVVGVLNTLKDADVVLEGSEVVLIGAGGAARAVVAALHMAGVGVITVANRTLGRAEHLRTIVGMDVELRSCPLDPDEESLHFAMARAALVIHSTPLGMRHGPDEAATALPSELFVPGQAVFDLVYTPEHTPFLQAAEAAGARPIGGLGMLVHQGAESFRLWTGCEPPLKVMFDVARAALQDVKP